MIRNFEAFAATWAQSWRDQDGSAPLLQSSPAYPLARTVPMPEGTGFETGAIGLRIHDLVASGLDGLQADGFRLDSADGKTGTLHLTLASIRLTGACSIDAKPDPVITLDIGGGLRELPQAPRPAGTDPTAGAAPSAKNEAWLNQARAQRDQLATTQNGSVLLAKYYQHNDAYAELFQKLGALRGQWVGGGVTSQMADDTSAALTNGMAVNSNSYTPQGDDTTYGVGGGSITYNYAAFTQQTNVSAAAAVYATNFSTGSAEYKKFAAAAAAAATFANHVNTTSNTQNQVTPMTGSDVYAAVTTNTQQVPEVQFDDLLKSYNLTPQAGGGAFTGDVSGLALDEPTLARIQAFANTLRKELAEQSAITGQPIFSGACGAELGAVDVDIAWKRERGKLRLVQIDVTLPAFAFDIDDSGWTGTAGETARQRLSGLHFLHAAIEDWVRDGIATALSPRVVATMADLTARR